MKRFTRLDPGRRALRVLLATVLSLGAAAVLVAPAGALPPTGPDPALVGASLSVDQHDGLVAGQVINYTVTVPSGHGIFGLTARLCHDPGPNPYTDPTFGLNGAAAIQCVNAADLGSVLTPSGVGGASYEAFPTGDGSQTTLTAPWKVGTGTVTWTNESSHSGSLTCDADHPCKLVVKANLNGSPSSTYFSQQLTFAEAPDPPAAPFVLTPGDHQVTVDFAASPADGNSPIDFYTVTAGAPCAVACSVNTADGSTTIATVTGLTNFQSYPFTVTAHNAAGFTSSAASAGNATPEPAPPVIISAVVDTSGGGGKILLTWDYTGSTTNPSLVGYRITPSGVGAPAAFETGSTNEFHLVTGLTNGEPYTFTVEASFVGGLHSDPSGASSAATPTGAAIEQIIDVNRPQGALVLTQACATPNPYPVDGSGVPNPTYPTTCTVHLGNAQFLPNAGVPSQPVAAASAAAGYPSVGEGQFFRADGAIHQVTIVDTRDSDVGWTVNGVLTSNFVSGANSFSAHQLGWQPAVTDKTPDYSTPGFGVYHNTAARGPDALPSNNALSLTGLGASRMLAQANLIGGGGLGIAHLDALLHILIPVYANAGVYTATLQITAV